MLKYPGTVTKITVRQPGALARGTTIDEYLLPDDNAALYAVWSKEWPEPFEFHGGIRAIACEQVLEIENVDMALAAALADYEKDGKKLGKSEGKKMAARILEVARNNAGRW